MSLRALVILRKAAFVAILCSVCGSAWSQNHALPAEGDFEDSWYAVMLDEKRAGMMHNARKRTGDSVESLQYFNMRIMRAGQTLEVTTKRVDLETVDGKPLGFSVEQEMGGATITKTGTISGGKLKLSVSQSGQCNVTEYDWHAESKLSWGTYVEQKSHELKPGARLELTSFDPDLSPSESVRITEVVGGLEEVKLLEGTARGVHVEVTTSAAGATIRSEDWLDEKSIAVRSRMNLMGIEFDVIRCTKQQAGDKLEAAEMFVGSMVAVDRDIDSHSAKRVVLRLTFPSEMTIEFPQTTMQKVKKTGPGTYELTISRIDHGKLKGASATRDTEEGRRFLKPTVFANSDDPEVKKMAATALMGAEGASALEIVDTLRRCVSKQITNKSLGIAFATASDVVKSREGDCSEHTVLLAALARVARIPARGVIGLVYVRQFAGRKNVFGFHMWTQVLLDGKWIDVDAALNETEVDPTHIALATTDLGDDGIGGGAALQIIQITGQLKIEVLKVE